MREVKVIGTFNMSICGGGTERVVSLLCKKWVRLGYEVVLFTNEEKSINDFEDLTSVKRVVLPNDYQKGQESYRYHVLSKAIEKYRVDVMIYHSMKNSEILVDCMACKKFEIPFIMYAHGIFSAPFHDRNKNTRLYLNIIKNCDLIVCLSEISKVFYQMLGVNAFRINNPIDENILQNKEAQLEDKNIVWLGHFVEDKKPSEAIAIFERVLKDIPDAHLYMCGTGKLEKALRLRVKQSRLEHAVHFMGFQKEVESIYMNASIHLMTSDYEGAPMVLLESKSYGVPTVMYDIPYVEMCKDMQGMMIAKWGNQEQAAHEIVTLLDDKEMRKQLGKEAKESLRNMYPVDYDKKVWMYILGEGIRRKPIYDTKSKMMLEVLLQHEEFGVWKYQNEERASLTYRLGSVLLKIPKNIYELIKRF